MKNILKILVVAVLAYLPVPAFADVLMFTNFEQVDAGVPFTRNLWEDEGFATASWDEGLATRTVVDTSTAASGLHALRVTYPKNQFGTDGTGCQVPLLFDKRDEAYMSYFLQFSENFSWGTTSYGGKLPGLAGGASCSGGAKCDGTNGWSARLMWRAGGKLVLYLYDMVKTETYGEDHQLYYADGSPVIAERGKWYHIAERVKMNSKPDSKDGEVQIWINGKEVLFLDGRQFASNGDKVDKLYISTFHGGDSNDWCPTDTCYTYFDDICVGTDYADVCYQQCRKPQLGGDRSLCSNSGAAELTTDLGDDYHLQWVCQGKVVGRDQRFLALTPGTYIVVADSGRCSKKDTVEVLPNLRVSLGPDRHICASSFITLNCGLSADDGLSFEWLKDGMVVKNENRPTLQTKDAGTYAVRVSAAMCESAEAIVEVTSGLLEVEDVVANAGDVVNISLKEPANYSWWDDGPLTGLDSQSVSIKVREGDYYIYVSHADGFSGNVGKSLLSENAWTRSNFSTEFMKFVAMRELTIDSVSIYPVKPLDATIRIVDADTKEVVFSQTYEGLPGGGVQRLAIGAVLPAGSYYMDALGTTGALYHSHTDADIKFPYTIDGLIKLNGCNLDWINNKGWYLYFYNWHVSAGNYCAPTPIKVEGLVPDGLDRDGAADAGPKVSVSNRQLSVGGMSERGILRLYNAVGQVVYEVATEVGTASYPIDNLVPGVYIVKIVSGTTSFASTVVIK